MRPGTKDKKAKISTKKNHDAAAETSKKKAYIQRSDGGSKTLSQDRCALQTLATKSTWAIIDERVLPISCGAKTSRKRLSSDSASQLQLRVGKRCTHMRPQGEKRGHVRKAWSRLQSSHPQRHG